jgi:hypothetical protein
VRLLLDTHTLLWFALGETWLRCLLSNWRFRGSPGAWRTESGIFAYLRSIGRDAPNDQGRRTKKKAPDIPPN